MVWMKLVLVSPEFSADCITVLIKPAAVLMFAVPKQSLLTFLLVGFVQKRAFFSLTEAVSLISRALHAVVSP
jgi:hypothetical protein